MRHGVWMGHNGRVYQDDIKKNVERIDSREEFKASRNRKTYFSFWRAMEGINHIKTGILFIFLSKSLSICDVKGEDQGCIGGLMDDTFQFIEKNRGWGEEGYIQMQRKVSLV
ncbi:hypothetical protein ACFE04_018027 [Oxalis oulophora]